VSNETEGAYEAVLDEVISVSPDSCDISLCLAASEHENDLPVCQKVGMTDNLVQEYRDIVSSLFLRCRRDRGRGDLIVREYHAESKLDKHEIECVDLSQVEAIRNQIEGLRNLHDIDDFDGSSEFVGQLKFYSIIIQVPNEEPIYCFRWYTAKRELSRSPWFAIWQAGGQYDKFTEPLLLFDDKIDCFSRGDKLFILNKDRFQRIFQYFEMVRQVATQTLSTIKAQIPISNFEEFEIVCHGNVCILAKLRNISRSPYINTITPAAIKETIDRLQLNVALNEDGALVFDPKKKWEFFRLLEDSYLESRMTGQNYEANSKRVIGGT
jgi:hypothetical protein